MTDFNLLYVEFNNISYLNSHLSQIEGSTYVWVFNVIVFFVSVP